MNIKGLMFQLYNALNADHLYHLIHNVYKLDQPIYWRPCGGSRNNSGTFEAQQSTAEASLAELLVNSIDTILLKHCRLLGIDPEDSENPNRPKDPREAIEKFFGIKDGRYENISREKRRELSSSIQLIAEGDTKYPNLIIYDAGEGANEDSVEATFVSINKGHKIKVSFTQGNYGMGSTGSVLFCGGIEKYKMIITRRCRSYNDCDGRISFTIIRQHQLSEDEERIYKNSWYEYLVIVSIRARPGH